MQPCAGAVGWQQLYGPSPRLPSRLPRLVACLPAGEISVRHIYYVAKHAELEWARWAAGLLGACACVCVCVLKPARGWPGGMPAAWHRAAAGPRTGLCMCTTGSWRLRMHDQPALVGDACCRAGAGGTSVADFLRQLGYRE